MLNAVEPQQVREQVGIKPPASTSFAEFMSAMAPAGAESAGQATARGDVANVTYASITGMAQASAPYGPYGASYGMGATATPFSSGGYGVPTTLGSGYGTGTYNSGSFGVSAGYGTSSTDTWGQQNQLVDKMRSSNMEMLTLQTAVQDENRIFSTLTNLLGSKHATEKSIVQNLRVA